MNLNELTIGQAKELASMFGTGSADPVTPHIGKKCIVRTYASGVFFGTVAAHQGRQVEMENARRMHRFWCNSGVGCSGLAMTGTKHDKSTVCASVPSITVLDALEIIPASEAAIASIESAPSANE